MKRRYDLDWLRVIAFGLLMLFHTGMLFSTWDWHVKNLETSPAFDYVMRFLHQWRMPLLFFISGSAVWFAMERYSAWRYFLERHKRLLLPLVFGMLVVIPPQVYHERLYHDGPYASFWDFYPTTFTTGGYPQGNLSWHHLWYVPYIWVYSMLLLPVCLWLRSLQGRPHLDRFLRWVAQPWVLFLAFIPSAISDALLRPYWPTDANNLTSDWGNFSHKLTFFIAGFVLASGTGVYDLIAAQRRKFLLTGVLSLVLIEVIWTSKLISAEASPVVGTVYLVFNNFFIWMWLLAALGYGRRWLSFNHPFLRYATEAVYPFYILHQTVIIIIGYHLAYVNWSLWLKFPLVAAATFLICWAIFALGIRPWNPVRVLFGMKWQRSNREEASHGERTAGQGARRPVSFGGIGMAGVALCLLTLCSCARSGGELVCTEIEAPSLLGNQLGFPARQRLVVYLPPSYRNGHQRFPVLYFLPNFDNILQRYTGGSYQGFRLKEAMDDLIRRGAIQEMIVVIPNAHNFLKGSWYLNSPLTGNWEDYVVKDVVKYTDSRFRTIPTAAARGLAGHGMGGSGALELALRHPDEFCAVYALSPALFDQNGMRDLGLLDPAQLARWKTLSTRWNALEEAARRKVFRNYEQTRLNSPSRETFLEGLRVAYAAAVSPDFTLPYPHIAFPSPDLALDSQSILLARYEDGLGDWGHKLSQYCAQPNALKMIVLEEGGEGDIPWIRRGVRDVAGMMRARGIPVDVEAHSGGHESKLAQRLESAMIPAIANALAKPESVPVKHG